MPTDAETLQNLAYHAIASLPERALRDAIRYFIESESRIAKIGAMDDRSSHLQRHLAAYYEGYQQYSGEQTI